MVLLAVMTASCKDSPTEPPLDPAAAQAIALQAQEVYLQRQYPEAITLTELAHKSDPQNRLATSIRGSAFCQLKDVQGVIRTLAAASPPDQKIIRVICSRAGVALP